MSIDEIRPVSRKRDIVIQELSQEILIYDLSNDKAYSLNEASALVWQMCDGNHSVADIACSLSKHLKSSVSEEFVRLALDQLKKENLLENAEEIITGFDDLSRREIIRKVGFAALVALPFVSSLIAPSAVNAASNCSATSGRSNGCTCTGAANCASNCCGRTENNTNECVTGGQDPVNAACRANCECASNSCNGTTNVCR